MMRARWHTVAVWLASGILLAGAALTNRCLIASGTDAARFKPAETGAMPPSVALTTVFLGGFRGLIADGLWIRAAMLQEQGRYFELVQLAGWITAMEPQYPQVWALQAWNMAFNVSVLMPDDESRWRWVLNGLELLRDRGLAATGSDPGICMEISLLFQHKIGGHADDRADYFKQRWGSTMHPFTIEEDGTFDSAKSDALAAALKMEPEVIGAVEDRYGKLDWRSPVSHAVYWAFAGLRRAQSPGVAMMCRRSIYQSMAALFEFGAITEDRAAGVMVFSPAFDLLPGVLAAFEDALPDDPVAGDGFAAFLDRAVRLYVFYHRPEEALPLFELRHSLFPTPETQAGFDSFTSRRQSFLPRIINTNTRQ